MPSDSRLELTIEVDANRANASIKTVNASLSSMEATAAKSARGAAQGIDGMTASMAKAVAIGNALYNAAVSAVRGIFGLATGALETQDNVTKMAQSIGVSVQTLSEMRHAASLSGLAMEDMSAALARFSRNVAQGSEVLAGLGIQARAQNGQLRDAGSILEDVADRFAGMPDGINKTAVSMELFGRSGTKLIPLLNSGAQGIREMRQEARDLGIVFDEQTGHQAEQLRDNIDRLKSAIEGLAFEALREATPRLVEVTNAMVQWLRQGGIERIAGYLKEVAEWVKNIGIWIVEYAVVRHILSVASALRTAAAAAGGFAAALAANPFGLIAAGVASFGVVLYREKQKIDDYHESLLKLRDQQAIRDAISKGATLSQLREQGLPDDAIREAMGAREFQASRQPRPGGGVEFDLEEYDRRKEAVKRAVEAQKRAADVLRQAQTAELTSIGKLVPEYQHYWAELGKTAKAQQDLAQAYLARVAAEAKSDRVSLLTEHERQIEQDAQNLGRRLEQEFRLSTEYDDRAAEMGLETARQRLAAESGMLDRSREAQLRGLEREGAQTIEQQLSVRERWLGIEEEYLTKKLALRKAELKREMDLEVASMEIIARAKGVSEEQIAAMKASFTESYGQRMTEIEQQTQAQIDAARENAAVRQAQLVRDHNQRVFDSFKRQAEGVFDALLSKSQSVWAAIGNSLQTALLTAIKEVVTSRVAAMLTQLFTGARIPVATGGAGAGGGFGSLGSLGGMMVGAGGIFGGRGPIPGGSTNGWGTPPFLPTGGRTGGWSGPGGLGSGWKDFFGFGGGVQYAPGKAVTWEAASMGQKLSALGRSNAALLGAGMLALMGLQRGGLSGIAMTTAGGAMIGFKYGGAVGAAVGAGVGAIAGAVRLFVKGAQEKAREKIKATYGVDISDRGVLKQIVDIAKQGFGGNLDLAIRTPQVRELVELYAMATGQKASGLPEKPRTLELVQRGSVISEGTQYSNGTPLPSLGFNTSAGLRLGSAPSAPAAATGQRAVEQLAAAVQSLSQKVADLAVQPIVTQVSIPGAQEFFERETLTIVSRNERVVQGATERAQGANVGRRQSAVLQLAPDLVVS